MPRVGILASRPHSVSILTLHSPCMGILTSCHPCMGMRCIWGDFGGVYVNLSTPPHSVPHIGILTSLGHSHFTSTSCGHFHLTSTSHGCKVTFWMCMLRYLLHAPLHVKIISFDLCGKISKNKETTSIPSIRYLLRVIKYVQWTYAHFLIQWKIINLNILLLFDKNGHSWLK